jgi:two-component system cell cycle sensor histidine kinase/response regulator CckA
LIVEDDPSIRTLVASVLQQAGYTVMEAESAGEALRIIQEYPARIDLMVTDVVMPHLSGPELSETAAQLRPDMKILYMSGYAHYSVMPDGLFRSQIAFLQKPFSPLTLAAKVREVLGSPSSPSN